MFKKLTCASLALVMLCTIFANGNIVRAEGTNEGLSRSQIIEKMNREIAIEKDKADRYITQELEKQNALSLKGSFERVFYADIESAVAQKYSHEYNLTLGELRSIEHLSRYAPNGGCLAYTENLGNDIHNKVVVTCLTAAQTNEYAKMREFGYKFEDILGTVFGFIPYVGTTYSVCVSLGNSIRKESVYNQIESAGGCAEFITVKNDQGGRAAMVKGWNSRYNITATATNPENIIWQLK